MGILNQPIQRFAHVTRGVQNSTLLNWELLGCGWNFNVMDFSDHPALKAIMENVIVPRYDELK